MLNRSDEAISDAATKGTVFGLASCEFRVQSGIVPRRCLELMTLDS